MNNKEQIKKQRVIKIKENELFMLLENQLTNPEKYGKRVELIKSLKDAKFYLEKSIERMDNAIDFAKHLPDEEIGLTSQINKCWVKLKKEFTEISNLLEEVKKGDLQPKQDEKPVDSEIEQTSSIE